MFIDVFGDSSGDQEVSNTNVADNAVSVVIELLQCPIDDPGNLVYYSTI